VAMAYLPVVFRRKPLRGSGEYPSIAWEYSTLDRPGKTKRHANPLGGTGLIRMVEHRGAKG